MRCVPRLNLLESEGVALRQQPTPWANLLRRFTVSDSIGPNPSGLCMCGCGQPAPIATHNDPRYGIIKGLPQRYIKGHRVFKSKSDRDYLVDANDCWIWQRAVNSSGYGHLYVDGKHKYAHVHYYEQTHGAVADNGRQFTSNQVHHLCANKLCVNPAHLVVHRTNEHRREHGLIRLTATDASVIRQRLSDGVSADEVAADYGISVSHATNIKNGQFWRR